MPPTLPSVLLNTINSHSGPINALTFSSLGGTYILTGSSDRQIHLSRTEPATKTSPSNVSSTPIQKYSAHGYAVLDLACASDNQTFASAGGDRSVFLWDVQNATTIRRFGNNTSQGHSSRVNCVAFAGEEDSVLISGSSDRTVRIWDCKSRNTNPIMVMEEAKDSVSTLAAPRTGYEILTGSVDGRVRAYDLRMGKVTVDCMPGPVTSLDITRDGKCVLISCLDGRIRLLDRTDGTMLQTFQGGTYVNKDLRIKACFGAGEAMVLAGSEIDGMVRAWDLVGGAVISQLEASVNNKVVSVVSWRDNTKGSTSGDGVWASGGTDGQVKIWGKG